MYRKDSHIFRINSIVAYTTKKLLLFVSLKIDTTLIGKMQHDEKNQDCSFDCNIGENVKIYSL